MDCPSDRVGFQIFESGAASIFAPVAASASQHEPLYPPASQGQPAPALTAGASSWRRPGRAAQDDVDRGPRAGAPRPVSGNDPLDNASHDLALMHEPEGAAQFWARRHLFLADVRFSLVGPTKEDMCPLGHSGTATSSSSLLPPLVPRRPSLPPNFFMGGALFLVDVEDAGIGRPRRSRHRPCHLDA